MRLSNIAICLVYWCCALSFVDRLLQQQAYLWFSGEAQTRNNGCAGWRLFWSRKGYRWSKGLNLYLSRQRIWLCTLSTIVISTNITYEQSTCSKCCMCRTTFNTASIKYNAIEEPHLQSHTLARINYILHIGIFMIFTCTEGRQLSLS